AARARAGCGGPARRGPPRGGRPDARGVVVRPGGCWNVTFVAAGRFDAYLEYGIRLWDIAAGGLILERAGGEFWHEPVPGEPHTFNLKANSGLIRRKLDAAVRG
ncbi:MAG: hypothetical protein HC814_07940, partial [Rhodobacteraceae bacterium]|nr:hypothetical protein [Paracoccaceae bacterium]